MCIGLTDLNSKIVEFCRQNIFNKKKIIALKSYGAGVKSQ